MAELIFAWAAKSLQPKIPPQENTSQQNISK